MALYSYNRQAGGIDVQEDVLPLLPTLTASTHSLTSWDVAHCAYVFDYLASMTPDRRVDALASALATEYAKRFAEWLGYIFLNRANMSRQTQAIKDLQEALGNWTEQIPDMLVGKQVALSAIIPAEAIRFLNLGKIDPIGGKIVKVVQQEWNKSLLKNASDLEELPVSFNPHTKRYEIPKSNLTYMHRNALKDLGFEFSGQVWYTEVLEPRALDSLPQVAKLQHGKVQPVQHDKDPKAWFFEDWLPSNINRFTKVFTDFGRAGGVPYEFKFTLAGEEVNVRFERNIKTVEDAITELEARYGGAGDREGWVEAIKCYHKLRSASGKQAIHAVDEANNLEHTHGAMMEHFPPGIRAWYPKFLDFKYTAHAWQLIRKIRDEDFRTVASELMPVGDRMQRAVTPQVDHRTPKGLALEISSQPGKARKKEMLKQTKKDHPDLYDAVVKMLEDRGLHLT